MNSNIVNFYNVYLNYFSSDNPSSVGWTDRHNQHIRFNKLFHIGIRNNDSVLDYGCGLGHLNEYMSENGLEDISYTGIDINPNYVEKAKTMYPDKVFKVGGNEMILGNDVYDYVIGSGVFTVGVTMDYIYQTIKRSYDASIKGVAFNFLKKESGLSPLLTYNISDIIDLLSDIGDIEVVEDYLGDEDFTIYIKK